MTTEENRISLLKKVEKIILLSPASQDMVNRIIRNINMDLIPLFKQRVENGFTVDEALHLEKTLKLCDSLPNTSELRKEVVTMDLDSLRSLNKELSEKVANFEGMYNLSTSKNPSL